MQTEHLLDTGASPAMRLHASGAQFETCMFLAHRDCLLWGGGGGGRGGGGGGLNVQASPWFAHA